MKRAQILLISTYAELTMQAKKIAKELNIPIDIYEGGILNNGHIYATSKVDLYDVIISISGTAEIIKKLVTTVPVLSIETTSGDILRALGQAIRFNKPLTLVSYQTSKISELENLTQLLNVKYQLLSYSSKQEFESQISRVMDWHDTTIVGHGGCVQELAHQKGMDYVLIKPSYTAIKQTLSSAKNIIEAINKDKFQNNRLTSIIDYSLEGVISVSKNGDITCFNTAAKKIFNLEKAPKTIHDKNVPPILKDLLGDRSFIHDKVIKVAPHNLIYSRLPININKDLEETIIMVQKVSYYQKIEYTTRMQLAAKGLVAHHTFSDIIHSSQIMETVIKNARRFSKTTATILIQGDTGTGKELFAQSIHTESQVKNGPFVAINCAALPEDLLESELFGYEEGAFTGARKGGKIGLFELAHNGTIFLDEIGELPLSIQNRLLRVLQEKEIMRIGGTKVIKVNVRVIAATNKDLYDLMMQNNFRPDLYFRLNVLTLKIPALHDRPEDIKDLICFFLQKYNLQYDRNITMFSPSVLGILKKYPWPGNIRELETLMEKIVITADSDTIDEAFIKNTLEEYTGNHLVVDEAKPDTSSTPLEDLPGNQNHIVVKINTLEKMEEEIIRQLLQKENGNKQSLANKLGISRATIWNKLKEKK
jgi:transcriptional regulator with PAS, ATPase and Fis domain